MLFGVEVSVVAWSMMFATWDCLLSVLPFGIDKAHLAVGFP